MTRHLPRLAAGLALATALLAGACADEAAGPIVDGAPGGTDDPTGPTTAPGGGGTTGTTVGGAGWQGALLDAHLDWLQLADGTLIDEGVGSFRPSADDAARFEAALPAALPTATNPSGETVGDEDLAGYVRQYTGVEADGHRHLVVGALCAPDDFPEWRTQWIEVMDGGACFWDATMDLDTGEIIRLGFHGAA